MTYHYQDLDIDTSSVWNFCSRSSDVISRETSCRVGKYQLFSHSPKLGGGGREKLLLAIKIIVAGLKSRELHEENVVSSLQPVITIIQRKDIRCCILINMFLRRENIKRINIFFSIFYTHFKGPVLKFSLSRTQIFHGQSEIWIQD